MTPKSRPALVLLPGLLCEPIDPVADPLPELPGLWRAYLRAKVYAAERR